MLEVGGRGAAECGVRRFSRRDLRHVSADRAGGRLAYIIRGALLQQHQLLLRRIGSRTGLGNGFGPAAANHQIQLCILRGKRGLGRCHVFGSTLRPHRGQARLLLGDAFLSGRDIVWLGPGLNRRQLRLRGGQVGPRL